MIYAAADGGHIDAVVSGHATRHPDTHLWAFVSFLCQEGPVHCRACPLATYRRAAGGCPGHPTTSGGWGCHVVNGARVETDCASGVRPLGIGSPSPFASQTGTCPWSRLQNIAQGPHGSCVEGGVVHFWEQSLSLRDMSPPALSVPSRVFRDHCVNRRLARAPRV